MPCINYSQIIPYYPASQQHLGKTVIKNLYAIKEGFNLKQMVGKVQIKYLIYIMKG